MVHVVSQTVYFTGMMVFTLTSQMYHRISVLVPVLVRVPEYLSMSTSTCTSTITLEITSTSTRNSVLEHCEYEYRVRVPQPWCLALMGWAKTSTCKMRRGTFKFRDLVFLILEIWQYFCYVAGLQKAGCNIHSFDIPETRYQKLRQVSYRCT